MPIYAAATPRVLTYIIPPEVTAQVQALRDNLYSTASVDKLKLCQDMSTKAAGVMFWPYGREVECRARQVRNATDFRKGIYYTFQHYRQSNRKDLADAIVTPLVAMIALEAAIDPGEGRNIVASEYRQIFGVYPLVPGAPTEPGMVEPPLRQPVTVGPVTPGPVPFPEDVFLMEEEEIPGAPAPKEFPWLIVGVGALVVLGGGYYLMTRKS